MFVLPSDPIVIELLPEFVDNWINDIEGSYKALLAEEKFDELYRMAHTIKGSCYQFGISHIGDFGVDLMNKIKERDRQAVADYETVLIVAFRDYKSFLEKNLQ